MNRIAYRFGKRPARPQSVRLRLQTYLRARLLPTPPEEFGYEGELPPDCGVLANDQFGDCVFAGADHETMLWTALADAEIPVFTPATALADYSAVTGFDPNDPASDQGTDMQVAASYRRKTGIIDAAGARHLVGAYVALEAGNLDQHRLAVWLFGAVGLGITISDRQVDQFKAGLPWDGPLGAGQGGHYVPLVGFRGGYLLVVTWGRVQRVSPAFFRAHNDESVAYFSEEMLKDGNGPTGVAVDELKTDLVQITSRPASAKETIEMPKVQKAAVTNAGGGNYHVDVTMDDGTAFAWSQAIHLFSWPHDAEALVISVINGVVSHYAAAPASPATPPTT